ncbi:VCBS domain-containing protein, partial [Shimia aestuarii]
NDSAVISGDTDATLAENTPAVSGNLDHADPDSADPDDLFQPVTTATASDQGYGTFTVSAAGLWTYLLDNTNPLVDALSPGETLTDSFTVLTGDGTPQIVTITITGTNDAPRITSSSDDASGSVTEGSETTSTSGNLSAYDPDNGSSVTWTGSAAGLYGAFVIAANGDWKYSLDNTLADSLPGGAVVTETFTVTVTDNYGATAEQDVVITVFGTNDAPILASEVIVQVAPGDSVTGTLTATDPDSSGPLTFTQGGLTPANGSVTIDTNGNFTYTPTQGFLGIDRFEYTVTDPEGGTSTSIVTIEVIQTSGGGDDDKAVSLDISLDATPDGPAGAVNVGVTPVDATAINLVFALDRSGSIGATGWAEQTEAVASAIEQLAEQFKGSATSVDIKIITYATDVTSLDTYDLLDTTLPDTVRALPYTRGLTNWTGALTEAKSFFDGEPTDESNFLFFITDGDPTSGGWQTVLADLKDVAENGYTVNIEAFGIGDSVNFTNLLEFDPTPVQLNSPTDLLDALTETPVFSPELVTFELTLEVDGVDFGVIADISSPALVADGLGYIFALAEIPGLADLLGDSNRFSVLVGFDLDGDPSTTEVSLFATEVVSASDSSVTLVGLNESDLLVGSDETDDISGAGGNDILMGFGGDDLLDGGTGADTVFAGAGDDRLIIGDIPLAMERLDGGEGRDVLDVDIAGDLGSDLLPTLSLKDIEAIDMQNGLVNQLELSLSDIVDLSSTADTLLESLLAAALPESAMVYGDGGDTLTLLNGVDGAFQHAAGKSVDDGEGNLFEIYEYVSGGSILATIAIDEDILVTTAPP